jgi:hypothetical protein
MTNLDAAKIASHDRWAWHPREVQRAPGAWFSCVFQDRATLQSNAGDRWNIRFITSRRSDHRRAGL